MLLSIYLARKAGAVSLSGQILHIITIWSLLGTPRRYCSYQHSAATIFTVQGMAGVAHLCPASGPVILFVADSHTLPWELQTWPRWPLQLQLGTEILRDIVTWRWYQHWCEQTRYCRDSGVMKMCTLHSLKSDGCSAPHCKQCHQPPPLNNLLHPSPGNFTSLLILVHCTDVMMM